MAQEGRQGQFGGGLSSPNEVVSLSSAPPSCEAGPDSSEGLGLVPPVRLALFPFSRVVVLAIVKGRTAAHLFLLTSLLTMWVMLFAKNRR